MKFDPELNAMLAFAIGIEAGDASAGLEAVEFAEQNRARNLCMLPREMKPSKEAFEALGFVFEEVGDNVLYKAKLPDGWSIKENGCYGTDFFDEKNRLRGASFYKGVFYDRCGHMYLISRFAISYEHINPNDWKSPVKVQVINSDKKVVFEVGQCKEAYSREYDKLVKKAKLYLAQNYPGWESPDKYWD